jgi:putative transposase
MISRSMSREANCWDNAVAELFFKTLLTEQIYGNKLISKEQMELDIFNLLKFDIKEKEGIELQSTKQLWKRKNKFKNVA